MAGQQFGISATETFHQPESPLVHRFFSKLGARIMADGSQDLDGELPKCRTKLRDQNAPVSIIVPTYNERENINELLERILRSMKPLQDRFEILIVDDDSPDETWKVASGYSDNHSVRVLRRNGKRGLAPSVLDGILASKYDIIVVIDADLQHPPETIPELVSEVRNGADIAIGSRFVDDGVMVNFGLFRRIVSRGADLLARTLFRQVRSVKDIESGFFAFHKDVVARARLTPVGYKILLEILVQGHYATVSEIAFRLEARAGGESKLGINNMLTYLRHILSLFSRSGELYRFLEFCVVGAVGAVASLIVLHVLTESGMFYLLAGVVATEVAILSNFTLNSSWTFRDRGVRGLKRVLTALYRDHAVRFVGWSLLSLSALWILTSFFGLYYMVSGFIGTFLATLWNYGGNQWWTWETH
jgi:dolichol-phosphate mannosyltransferase